MRTFIAIPLSKEVKKQLADTQSRLKTLDARITWVNPKILHITLEFLGDVDATKIAEISTTIKTACQEVPPFELKLGKPTLIPNASRPRVIAASVTGNLNSFYDLQTLVQRTIQPLRLDSGQQKAPHITLGRIKGKFSLQAKQRFSQITQTTNFTSLKRVKVDKIVFMQSTLTSAGPIYNPIAEIPLEKNR
ncbi:MAG: RNA 2',3'-cyclic phosphodiesterase [Candidatus Cloacimonetes bacterium]|nr:RNA 2',3'-cyclic phosphodiesterase [Candidatus Cloacimonadota bacterium]